MDKRKEDSPSKKDDGTSEPPKTPPSLLQVSIDSSIDPSSTMPSCPVPPDPEIGNMNTGTNLKHPATAVDQMMLEMGQKNLQPASSRRAARQPVPPTQKNSKQPASKDPTFKNETAFEADFIAREREDRNAGNAGKEEPPDTNVAERKRKDRTIENTQEDDEPPNTNDLFPGLKKIGRMLGFSPKKPKKPPEEKK